MDMFGLIISVILMIVFFVLGYVIGKGESNNKK